MYLFIIIMIFLFVLKQFATNFHLDPRQQHLFPWLRHSNLITSPLLSSLSYSSFFLDCSATQHAGCCPIAILAANRSGDIASFRAAFSLAFSSGRTLLPQCNLSATFCI